MEIIYLLGRLGGEARRLPNPHIFLRPFVRREAVFSSRIEGTQAIFDVVGLLAQNPFLTARKAEASLDVSYNRVNRSIAVLEKKGIVERVGNSKRDRVYCATKLLEILDEPARLTG